MAFLPAILPALIGGVESIAAPLISGIEGVGSALGGALGGAGAAGAGAAALTPAEIAAGAISPLVVTAPAAAAGLSPALAGALGAAGAGTGAALAGAGAGSGASGADQIVSGMKGVNSAITPTNFGADTVSGSPIPNVGDQFGNLSNFLNSINPTALSGLTVTAPQAGGAGLDVPAATPLVSGGIDTTLPSSPQIQQPKQTPDPLGKSAENFVENKLLSTILQQALGFGNAPSGGIVNSAPGTSDGSPPISSTNAPVTGASTGTPFAGSGVGPGAGLPGGLAINGSAAPNIFPWVPSST